MKKYWLAVISDSDLTVARVAVGTNNVMKIMSLSEYKVSVKNTEAGGVLSQEFAEIKSWLQELNIPLKKLKITVSSLGLITRVITLPQMCNDDLEKLIFLNANKYFTINVYNYIIDYKILNRYWENERQMVKVLLAAFPKERMRKVWSLCQYLGFEPTVIDLTADCLTRIYSRLIDKNQVKNQAIRSPESAKFSSWSGDVAIISLRAKQIEFVLLENGIFFLYSDMEFNTQAIGDRYFQNVGDASSYETTVNHNTLTKELFEQTDWEEHQKVEQPESFQERDRFLNGLIELGNEHVNSQELSELQKSQALEELANDQDNELHMEIPAEEEDNNQIPKGEFGLEDDVFLNEDSPWLGGFQEEVSESTELPIILPEKAKITDNSRQNLVEETGNEGLKYAAMDIKPKKEIIKEFVLEDLFVPLEELDKDLTLTLTNHELEKKTNTELNQQVSEKNIFDALDLNRTMVGPKEAKNNRTDKDPKKELQNYFNPVISSFAELLSFFKARHFGHSVNTVYLTGEYCTLPFLTEIFQENLGVQTMIGFPDGWKPKFKGNSKTMMANWQKYGDLYGLALRED